MVGPNETVVATAEAASVLRSLGLPEMTESALRTRAYRKQVPFHLNGRRIVFTLSDLREIAEGETRRPLPRAEPAAPGPAPRPALRRLPAHQGSEAQPHPWRARASHGLQANPGGGDRT